MDKCRVRAGKDKVRRGGKREGVGKKAACTYFCSAKLTRTIVREEG